MREDGAAVVVLDGRPYTEYHKMSIPGGVCCPNAELPYRLGSMVRDSNTAIVVNCAGRTRSIIGAQTLIDFGVRNPVYALENGTQGWVLSDLELERGAARKYPAEINVHTLPTVQSAAQQLMARFGIRIVAIREVQRWLEDDERTTYVIDIRTPEEYAAGSIAGAVHAPGGQLIQATDHWIGVRHARIVLVDGGEQVRAPMAASWLARLGYEAYVLEGGIQADLRIPAPPQPALPRLHVRTAAQLEEALRDDTVSVLDLGSSTRFRKAHIPGSRWSIRPRVVKDAQQAARAIVLAADEESVARLASLDLAEAGMLSIELLEGGFSAWLEAGKSTESSPRFPEDQDCIDYLFFVHDRHAGNREAMRQYLAWETGLIAQLDEDERASFRVEPLPRAAEAP
jgi:cystathionine beta-lyase